MFQINIGSIEDQLKTRNVIQINNKTYPVETGLDNNTVIKWVTINDKTYSVKIR